MVKNLNKISSQEMKRVKAKTLLKAKVPIQKIPKATRLSMKTVERLQKRRSQRKKGSGRKPILRRSQKISIRNLILHNPFYTAEDIIERLDPDLSSDTVRSYLKELGLSYKNSSHKDPLSEFEKNERLKWCRNWQDSDKFDEVIFTDEAGIWLNDNKGKGWFPSGKPFIECEVESREKINIWGAISLAGKVGIYTFRDNFNAGTFEDVLRQVLVPVAQDLYPDGCYLQMDNSQVHKAVSISRFLNSKEADIITYVLPWPTYSPDLNPIENLWAVLKRKIRKRRAKTIDQLEDIIHEEWASLSENYVKQLCRSIHKRIEMCIENEGDKINY